MTLEEEFSLLLDCGVTLEEDFALLLDFALEFDCGVTLEEDFAELLDATLEEDFALLLDFALELDCGVTLEEDFAELLDATLEEDFTLLLDFALTEEEDLAELLDTLVSSSLDCGVTSSILLDDVGESQSSQIDEEESSASGLTKLPLSSSPHAAKNANTAPTANNLANFIFLLQIIWFKYNQSAK